MSIAFILLGVMAGVALIMKPKVAIWTLVIMSLVIIGPIQYFLPKFHQVKWMVSVISAALFIGSMMFAISKRPGRPPAFIFVMGVLIVSVLTTMVLNRNLYEFFIASKNFFQFWSIPLAMFCIIDSPKETDRLFKAVMVIGLIQPPVAIIQYLLFSKAGGFFGGDSVAGTLGGSMASGGPNAALAIFMCLLITYTLLKWMNRRISLIKTGALCVWFIIPILITNAKGVILFFGCSFLLIFKRQFRKKRLRTIITSGVLAAMMVGILFYYFSDVHRYTKDKRYAPRTISEYINQTIRYNFGTEGGELTRFSAILFWFKEHSINQNSLKALFGHGLGATKDSGIISGHLLTSGKYRGMGLSKTDFTLLLWDIGLIGTSLFILIFVLAFFTSGKIIRKEALPQDLSDQLFLTQIACMFFLLALPYKEMIIKTQSMSALSMLFLGYLACWVRFMKDKVLSVSQA